MPAESYLETLDPRLGREAAFTVRGRDYDRSTAGVFAQFDIDPVNRFARMSDTDRSRRREDHADDGNKSEPRHHGVFPLRPSRPLVAVA